MNYLTCALKCLNSSRICESNGIFCWAVLLSKMSKFHNREEKKNWRISSQRKELKSGFEILTEENFNPSSIFSKPNSSENCIDPGCASGRPVLQCRCRFESIYVLLSVSHRHAFKNSFSCFRSLLLHFPVGDL